MLSGQDDLYGDVSEYYRSDPTLAEDDGDHGVAAPAGAWLFHRDEHGKTCFNEAEARAACELIAAIKLDERVFAAMADTEFVFPQEHASPRAFVCNGEAYGEFVLLQARMARVASRRHARALRQPLAPTTVAAG